MRMWLVSGVASLVVSAGASAQVEVLRLDGQTNADGFGGALLALGDVDGDGRGDLAVGEALVDGAAGANCGRVRLISGRTHVALWSVEGASAGELFGHALSLAGDRDGDGRPDFVAGAPRNTGGFVRVLSGASGAPLLQISAAPADRAFGFAVASGHDVNGDGQPDLVVGAPSSTFDVTSVRVFDGLTGLALRSHGAAQSGFNRCGWAVAFLGDVNGDGVSEYAFSSNYEIGLVEAHDGASGALLWTRSGFIDPAAGDQLGYVLAPIADQDFDGRPDLVATAPQDATTESFARGYAVVLSGLTGATIAQFGPAPQPFSWLGNSAAAVDDIDGDGRADVALTAPGQAPLLRIFSSGAPAAPLVTVDAGEAERTSLAFGDVSGDGLIDVALGLPGATFPTPTLGQVRVYSIVTAPTSYCSPEVNSLGCTPAISSTGAASVSSVQPFVVSASNLLNQKTGLMFYGFAPQQTPFTEGSNCIAPPRQRTPHQLSGGSALPANDCSGTIALDFNARIQLGVDPLLVAGSSVFAQVWSRDPGDPSGTNLSDARAFSIAP